MTPRRISIKKHPGVYRSSSGKYEIAFRDGEGKLRFQTVAGDLQDAVKARAKIIERKDKGEPVDRSKQSFGDYAEQWHAGLNKRPRTLEGLPLPARRPPAAALQESPAGRDPHR